MENLYDTKLQEQKQLAAGDLDPDKMFDAIVQFTKDQQFKKQFLRKHYASILNQHYSHIIEKK